MRGPPFHHASVQLGMLAVASLLLTVSLSGCSRTHYRLEADREVYSTIGERNSDPRWRVESASIEMHPQSRFHEPYHQDCPPKPSDDPAAHRYMHCVDGKEGWPLWHANGLRGELENPGWYEFLLADSTLTADGAILLDLPAALRLAYVHSPLHQRQLETLYSSSLNVTGERFALDTQYFGGYGLAYQFSGDTTAAAIGETAGTYSVNGPFPRLGSNRLIVGAPTAAGNNDAAFRLSRRFATAGELAVGFANSFVFEFNGPNANLSSSLLNFTLRQPLLRGAGRDIALEPLTQAERNLLGTLRSYAQFRQGFYTSVAIGEIGVPLPREGSLGTDLDVFRGLAAVSGYVGLLQQQQQIRNAEDNLELQVRTLIRLEDLLQRGYIDLVQVDQFRQNVERDRAQLLQQRNQYLLTLDSFKTQTLGLPPDLEIELDDGLIETFQLVDRNAIALRTRVADLQQRVGRLQSDASDEQIGDIESDVTTMLGDLGQILEAAAGDIDMLDRALPSRLNDLEGEAAEGLQSDVDQLTENLNELRLEYAELQADAGRIGQSDDDDQVPSDRRPPNEPPERIPPVANDDSRPGDAADGNLPTDADGIGDALLGELLEGKNLSRMSPRLRDLVVLLRRSLRLIEGTTLVQARARLESVTVEPVRLPPRQAYGIALVHRLDFMNARAALVDSWRQIQVQADALQSGLDFTAGGDIRTDQNNPLDFNSGTATGRLGLRFDAPLTRLLERNAYRRSLISYQRSRRDFIQSRDALHQGLRVLLRELERLRLSLEIQRRAVAIAIRRVDLTTRALEAPVRPPQPGQRPAAFGPTAAFNLLSAQAALRDTQDAFLSAYVSYFAARMRLSRELGIMLLDDEGRWVEAPFPGQTEDANDASGIAELPEALEMIPPPIPDELVLPEI